MQSLLTPLRALKGIGPVLSKRFQSLGIETLENALFFFPVRHEDWRTLVPISQAEIDSPITLRVEVEEILSRRSWKKRGLTITEARVRDEEGTVLPVTWFNMPYLSTSLPPGTRIFLSGTLESKSEKLTMTNPVFELVSPSPSHQLLVPIYRSIAGISQRQIRQVIAQAVELASIVPDHLSPHYRQELGLPDRPTALRHIHFPPSPEEGRQALRRLQFDELLAWQVRWQESIQARQKKSAYPLPFDEQRVRGFVQRLPFELTNDQRLATWQILQDIAQPRPMFRLLQGDVGTGKTVVAAIVALMAARYHVQTAVVAPTMILAEQHATTFRKLLAAEDITIALGRRTGWNVNQNGSEPVESEREQALQADIIIGTHALLQEDIRIEKLGFVIVDEQQRFGVAQRHFLLDTPSDELTPHFLSMTATPIPRTMELVTGKDVELSRLTSFPTPRTVTSRLVKKTDKEKVLLAVKKTLAKHEQVIVITPTIEDSDTLGVSSVASEVAYWKSALPEATLAGIHSGVPSDEREEIMRHFQHGEIQLLVGTTVIEVGIDIPQATMMVIENAERFGLAQLHQLRGRIARRGQAGLCLFVAGTQSAKTLDRLKKVASTQDGLILAQLDREIRGPGDIYGLQQSGLPNWKLATLDDTELLRSARLVAKEILLRGETAAIFMDESWTNIGQEHRE